MKTYYNPLSRGSGIVGTRYFAKRKDNKIVRYSQYYDWDSGHPPSDKQRMCDIDLSKIKFTPTHLFPNNINNHCHYRFWQWLKKEMIDYVVSVTKGPRGGILNMKFVVDTGYDSPEVYIFSYNHPVLVFHSVPLVCYEDPYFSK